MKGLLIFIFVCITNHSIAQSFSEKTSNGFIFAGEENSAAAFVDVDNDGDEDLLYFNIFYKNNDEEGFSSFFTFVGASNVIAFADYNGDGFADILFGNTLYRSNAGTGFTAIRTFTETPNAISFADFNNDDSSRYILTGSTSSVLYRNNNGAFTQEQTLSGGTNSTYGDIDSDGDMDIIISKNTPPYSIIYENRNTGFVSVFENILTRTTTGTPNLIDFDADGDLDIFVSNTLYKNNETGFSSSASLFISSFNNYHSSWADMDNDGFADLVISGTENAIPTLTIYKNNRTSFAAITSIPNITKHTLTDVDSDGDMDLFFSETGRFYENKTTIRNNPPNIPQGLDAIIQGDEILLSWGNVSDIETPIQGIRYELYFSSLRGHNNSFFSAPRQETERRILRPDSAGVYYWTVRSVDAGGLRSNIGSLQRIVLVSTKETSNITPRSATAHWSAIPDASYYIFQLATNANFTNFVTGYRNLILTDNFKTISSLLPNTPYYYRIVAVTPEIKSDYSNTMSFTTLSPGNFISSTIPSASLKNGSSNFVDYDNDGDMDFFTNGQKTIGTTTHSIFQVAKNTNGTFASPTAISNTFSNHTIFGDFNHDNKVDVLMGENFYTNQNPSFSKVSFTFPNIPSGSSNFVDFDNDGDRDVFVTGYNNASAHRVSQLFQNNKTGFSEVFPTNFTDMDLSASAFGDIDNDGDMDALISGIDGNAYSSSLFKNENGVFTETTNNLTGIKKGNVQFFDYDNDGLLDILIVGNTGRLRIAHYSWFPFEYISDFWYSVWLWGNLKTGTSHYQSLNPADEIKLLPTSGGTASLDISEIYIYRNNGTGFDLKTNIQRGFEVVKAFPVDVDNDGDKDIILSGKFINRPDFASCGGDCWNNYSHTVYKGNWQLHYRWFTYGYSVGTKVFINDNGNLRENYGESFEDVFYNEGVSNSTQASIADTDGDGDIDFFVNAQVENNYYSKVFENMATVKNTPPTAPEGLVGYSYGLGKAVFIWANAEDAQIPEEQTRHTGNGLNYNMYVGTAANKNIIRSAEANTTTGYRWQAEAGSLQGNVYKLENIANGNYVWGIQAIDQGMRGGNWTPEQTLSLQNKTTAQSITFDTLVRKRFLDPPFIVSATTTSGLPVSFLSTNTKVATINGNTVTIIGAGKTNIIAMQSGNSSYYGAYPVTRILNVEKVKQSITFTNVPIQTVGVPFQFSITANSSRPVLFYTQWTRDDLSYWECYYSWYEYGGFYYKYGPDVSRLSDQYFRTQPNCRYVRDSSDIYYTGSPFITVNGISSFSADRTGTTNIAATQEEETLDYLPADQVVQTFFVKGFQTITFFKVGAKVYGDVPFVLDSRSIGAGINLSQRGEISISYSSSNTQILSIVNNTATVRGVGTVSITAFSSGSDLYFPAHTSQVVTIKKARQSITFDLPLSKTFGDAPFKIIAYSQNSFPVSFKTSHTFVQIQNDSIQMLGSGVAKIIAFHTGNQYYDSASVVRYLTIIDINKATQYISFDDIPQDTLRSLQDSIELRFVAISSSSLPIEYAIAHNEDLQNSIVSSRDSFTVTSAGIYTITAFQDGDATYNPAIPITKTCTIKRSQSIFFTEIPPKNYESAPFYINLYATSGLDTRISLSNDSVLQIDPDYLATITKTGTVNISATQSGDNEYYPAPDAFQSIVIAKADQYLVFKPIPSKVYENPPIILPITTNAGLPIIYSSVSNLIAIAQNTVSILAGGGIAKIAAYNSGNANYNALIPIFRSFYIEKASQDMSFPSVPNKVYGDAPIVFQPTSNKRIPIVYASSNENVIRFEGNSAFILRADANTVTISATANETNQYTETRKTQGILVSPAPQVITFPEPPIVYLHEKSFVLNARSTNTLPITYSSSNPNIAYITGNTVFFQTFGNVFITASQPSVENYYQESNTERQLLTIKDITALDNDIPSSTGISYVGDTTRIPRTYNGIPTFFYITKNTNGNGKTIAFLDEDNRWIIFLDTGKLEVKIYTQPVINRTQRINPAVAKINITVKITYNIGGRVLGANNEVVPGFVILTNPTLRESLRAELSHGYFSIENVPEDWTFYLQAFPKGSSATSYYPTYYGSKQAIVWRYADTVTLTSHRTNFNWKLRPKPKTSIGTGNGTIIGTVLLDTTENQNRILYGNFFGAGVRYPYAHIFLKSTADSLLSTDISRTNGEFYFTKLPVGYYRIEVDVPGTTLKNLNDAVYLPNEENILYLSVIIGKGNAVELFQYLGKRPQTIQFPPVYKYYGNEPFPIAATATSGLPLIFSSSSSLISITENIATIYGAGTSIITAFQSGNEYYIPSDPTSQIMVVQKAYQTITMQTNIINDPYTFSERRALIKANASSGLPVQLTPSEPTITNRGDTFFVRGIASFKMTAFQKGNENYHPEQIFQDIIIDPNAIAVENPFITIFPNPADDYITIQWDKNQKVSSIRLYDIKGDGVMDMGDIDNDGISIDIKTLPKGEYIVVVYGEKGEILKAEKVIIH